MTPEDRTTFVQLETDALRRMVELLEARRIRLRNRIGDGSEVVGWVESAEEEDDEDTLAALRAFEPVPWWLS